MWQGVHYGGNVDGGEENWSGFRAPFADEEEKLEIAPMEEENSEEEEQNAPIVSPHEFGVPAPFIVYNDKGEFCFSRDKIPAGAMNVYPTQALAAFERIDGFLSGHLAAANSWIGLPVPVHASPILALFGEVIPGAVIKKAPVLIRPEPSWHETVTSFSFSAVKLQEYCYVVKDGGVPFLDTATPKWARERALVLKKSLMALEIRVNDALDALFDANVWPPTQSTMEAFVQLLEQSSLQYIWLHEHYLYETLVVPHLGENRDQLPLEAVLTPHLKDASCGPSQKQLLIKDVVRFFTFAQQMRDERETMARQKQMTVIDSTPHVPIRWDTIEARIQQSAPEALFKGVIPYTTLIEYYAFLQSGKK